MGGDQKPIVYVSYHLEKERVNNTLINLQDKLTEAMTFKVDRESVRTGEDFMDFIHEIGAANKVIVIFSKEYFKSFWCMYELTKIVQHEGDIQSRVLVVRENDYKLNNENNKKYIRDYWRKLYDLPPGAGRPGELTEYGTPERIKEIWETLETTFDQLSTKEGPTPRRLIKNRYIDILNWLESEENEHEVAERQYVSDEDFLQEIRLKIQSIVKVPSINSTLKEAFDCKNEHDSVVLDKLCTEDSSSLIKTLDDELKNVRDRLKSRPDYVNEFREKLREMVSYLIYFVVNQDWVKQVRNKNITILEIPARSELAGSAASAVVHQTYKQCYHAKDGSSHVESRGKVLVPTKQLSWSNKNNKIARGLIAHIYNHVFPDSPYKALDEETDRNEIDDDEIEGFNDDLLKDKAHFFLIVPDGQSYSYLDDPVLLHEMKRILPALIIIKLAAATDAELVIAEDVKLRYAYRRFLKDL